MRYETSFIKTLVQSQPSKVSRHKCFQSIKKSQPSFRKNKIERIKNSKGAWLDTRDETDMEICKNLISILSSSGLRDFSQIRKVIQPKSTPIENDSLLLIPTTDENGYN